MGNVKIKMGGHWRKITEEGLEELISRYESQLANTKRGLVRKTEMLEHLISRRPKQLEIKEQPSAHGKPTMVGMEEAGMKKINRDKFWVHILSSFCYNIG